MDPAKYQYQSEFAKRYVAQGKAEGKAEGEAKGKAEGRAEGRAAIVLKLLALKFGKLSAADVKRVQTATVEDLDTWTERVLSASALPQVWKPKKKR
jgi:predicted transposase YdaD